MICFGRMSLLRSSITLAPQSKATCDFFGSTAGTSFGAHGRDSEERNRGGHGVGGVLATAGASAGTGAVFEFDDFFFGHSAGRARADGFEDVLNGDVAIVEPAGHDGAAVERKGRQIQAGERHYGAGDSLVAPAKSDHRVEGVGHDEEFDRVSDHFTGDERRFHALGAHGDAVGNGDGVKLDGGTAGGANAFLHFFRERAQMEIAGRDFRPGIGDGDQRAREIGVGEAGGLEHGAGGRSGDSLFYFVTVHVTWASLLPRTEKIFLRG